MGNMQRLKLLQRVFLLWLWSFAIGCQPCTGAPEPGARTDAFSVQVPPESVLEDLRRLSGIGALQSAPADLDEGPGYTFILPPEEGGIFVVTVVPDEHERSGASGRDLPASTVCLDSGAVQAMPFSFGVGGASRGVEFTTWDGRYSVKVSVFEKLRSETESRPLNLHSLADAIAKKYCAATGGPSARR